MSTMNTYVKFHIIVSIIEYCYMMQLRGQLEEFLKVEYLWPIFPLLRFN